VQTVANVKRTACSATGVTGDGVGLLVDMHTRTLVVDMHTRTLVMRRNGVSVPSLSRLPLPQAARPTSYIAASPARSASGSRLWTPLVELLERWCAGGAAKDGALCLDCVVRRSIHSVPMRLSLYVRGTRLVRSLSRDRESGKHHSECTRRPHAHAGGDTRRRRSPGEPAGAAGTGSHMVADSVTDPIEYMSPHQHAQHYTQHSKCRMRRPRHCSA
jgi:hypothetical protein